jgi:predicted small metal-binding protein
MATVIECGRVNPVSGCGHVIQADSEEEELRLAAKHAQKDHGIQPTPELMAKVKEHMHQT